MRNPGDRTVALLAAAGVAMAAPRPARAHAVGVSSGEYRLDGATVYGDVGMADRELAHWQPVVDTDHDGAVSADELVAGRDAVGRTLLSGLVVAAGDRACPGTMDRAWVTEGGAVFQVRFTCPAQPRTLTLAHSITLALAARGSFAPSPRLVEPAIALSIAYVGVENLFVADARKRWRITCPFGLIHGFGFAGALRAIALPRPQVPVALIAFNAGVELGQLAVLALALPLVMAARRAPWFGDRGGRIASGAIAAGGAALFVVRLANRQ